MHRSHLLKFESSNHGSVIESREWFEMWFTEVAPKMQEHHTGHRDLKATISHNSIPTIQSHLFQSCIYSLSLFAANA
jgi:hypothetical protein